MRLPSFSELDEMIVLFDCLRLSSFAWDGRPVLAILLPLFLDKQMIARLALEAKVNSEM